MKKSFGVTAIALALTAILAACSNTGEVMPEPDVSPEVTPNVVTRGANDVARGVGDVGRGIVNGTGEVIEGVGNGVRNVGNGIQNAAQ